MDLSDLLHPKGVLAAMRASSKKQALQELAARAHALTEVDEREVFDTLIEREKLGSTGIGHGVAIPHGKLAGIDRIHALFARLERPIDFEAVDEQPVDLIFVLLVPEDAGAEHLKALARVSRLLRSKTMLDQLRATDEANALYALLTEPHASAA